MSSASTTRAVLIYDGDCGICTRLADFTRRRLHPRAQVRPSQDLDLALYGLTQADCDVALQFVRGDGRVYAAQNAVSMLLRDSDLPWRPLGHALRLPLVNQLAGVVYRLIAANRHRLPGGTPACTLPTPPTPDDHPA